MYAPPYLKQIDAQRLILRVLLVLGKEGRKGGGEGGGEGWVWTTCVHYFPLLIMLFI